MKKLMCVLAAVALVAVVSTSCKKTCTCKGKEKVGGNSWSYTYTKEDLDKYNLTCKEMETIAKLVADDVKCK